jgi:RNA polymerase sigma factor (sigma-70 family)
MFFVDDDLSAAGPSDVSLLVKEAAAGNETAWNQLIARFSPMVASIARAYRLSAADVDDLCQTVWLRLVEGIGAIRDPERVGAWLAAVARHEALRLIRRAGREAPVADTGLDETPSEERSADERVLAAERKRAVWAAIDRLPPRTQDLMRHLLADPMPGYGLVAALLGIPVNSVGPTRSRALRALGRSPELAAVGLTTATTTFTATS